MPLYMDVPQLGDKGAFGDVTKAHLADLETQDKYNVKYLRYWVDEDHGQIFCLVEAPSSDAAATVHREARGLVAREIGQAQEGPGGASVRWWQPPRPRPSSAPC